MTIQSYEQKFYEACIDIFRSNVPDFFSSDEEAAFTHYLREYAEHYFVLTNKGHIIACGGYEIDNQAKRASLVWGMVHRNFHRNGFGSKLFEFRLKKLGETHPNVTLFLDTSQNTYKFYKRFGFVVEKVVSNGYGPGLDQYDMRLDFEN